MQIEKQNRIFGLIERLFKLLLFIPIQIAFVPLALVGLVIGVYKEMVIGKKRRVSFSAIKALQYRWNGHYFGIRPDPLSVSFIKKFPCESHFGLWALMGALIIAKRWFGFSTKATRMVEPEDTFNATSITRLRVFDRIMEKYLPEVDQIVIPGVGFDLLALNHVKGSNIKVFELDQENTLNIKVETLKKVGIECDFISYIPVDYGRDSWSDKLLDAGFDKSKKTLFIWQSVSLFLEEEVVIDSLKKMHDLCSEGSIVIQDFYSKAFINGTISSMARKQFNLFEKQGEIATFALEMSDSPKQVVDNFLNMVGLRMTDFIQFGKNINVDPFYCIVEAKR